MVATRRRLQMTVFPVLALFLFAGVCSSASIYGVDTYEAIFTHLGQVGGPDCKRHVQHFLVNLQNFTAWADQMYDSGGKLPRSINTGSSYLVGNYDVCIDVNAVDNIGVTFQGQYCVVSIKISHEKSTNDLQSSHSIDIAHGNDKIPDSKGHVFQRNYYGIGLDSVHWSLCIPSSCSHIELEEAMNKTIGAIGARHGVELRVAVPPIDCSTLQEGKKEIYEDVFIFSVSCLSVLCLLSTVYDCMVLWKPETPNWKTAFLVDVFLGFSMRKNFEELVKEPAKLDGLRILYGIRVISTVLIIAFHRILYTTLAPLHNPGFLLSNMSTSSLMLFRSGEMAVDTFFTMSAFLLANSLLRRDGKFSLPQHIFKRYMRLTPVLLFTITELIILIDHMANYPLWKPLVSLVQRPCLNNWMSNIMYLNNYEKLDDMCLVNAWYLGADMQLYVISTFLVLLVIQFPSFAFPCCCTVTFLSIAVPFAATLSNGVPPVLLAILDRDIHPLVRMHLEHLYWPTQCRAGPYVVGMAVGCLYYKIQSKEWKFPPQMFSWASLFLSATCCFGPLYISAMFHDDVSVPHDDAPGAALFAATNRFVWGLGIGALILNVATRADGILFHFLGHKVFVFLGKLTYSSFMANILISVYFLGSTRQPIMLSNVYYLTNILLDLIFTFAIGFFVHLIVEQPFRNLSELICRNLKAKDVQKKRAGDKKNN